MHKCILFVDNNKTNKCNICENMCILISIWIRVTQFDQIYTTKTCYVYTISHTCTAPHPIFKIYIIDIDSRITNSCFRLRRRLEILMSNRILRRHIFQEHLLILMRKKRLALLLP